MNRFLKQVLATILIVFSGILNAQVRIKVIDEETGETLFRVIASENKKFLAYSDLDGIIEFGKSQSKERQIKLSLFGFRDTLIQLNNAELNERLVVLSPNRQTLNTYVVSGNRYIQWIQLTVHRDFDQFIGEF